MTCTGDLHCAARGPLCRGEVHCGGGTKRGRRGEAFGGGRYLGAQDVGNAHLGDCHKQFDQGDFSGI